MTHSHSVTPADENKCHIPFLLCLNTHHVQFLLL